MEKLAKKGTERESERGTENNARTQEVTMVGGRHEMKRKNFSFVMKIAEFDAMKETRPGGKLANYFPAPPPPLSPSLAATGKRGEREFHLCCRASTSIKHHLAGTAWDGMGDWRVWRVCQKGDEITRIGR